VCVSEDNRIQLAGVERERVPVAPAECPLLYKAAVHEHARAVRLEQSGRAGYAACSAKEGKRHARKCRPLERPCQTSAGQRVALDGGYTVRYDVFMRTTADIDDDLMRRLKDRAHRSGKSVKKTLNEVIARGLSDAPEQAEDISLPSWEMGHPLYPLDQAWELDARLELESARHEMDKSS